MKFSASLAAFVATAGLVSAAPLEKRFANDADVLQYALFLEHLESRFYQQGLANYSVEQFQAAGFNASFYKNLGEVSADEKIHVETLEKGLTAAGAVPIKECTYDFSAVKDVKSFITVASVLEGVGVSAYLGAAAAIMNKDYLTLAGSILTVESRHSAYLRDGLGQSPFPSPFDVPLSSESVATLATPFVVECPAEDKGKVNVTSFTKLSLEARNSTKVGDEIKLDLGLNSDGSQAAFTPGTNLFAAFINVAGPIVVDATGDELVVTLTVPEGVSGQSYVVLMSCNGTVSDDTVLAGPAIVEVTPEYLLSM